PATNVTVAAGAQLDVGTFTSTLNSITVTGSPTASVVGTTGTITLGAVAGTVQLHSIASTSAATITAPITFTSNRLFYVEAGVSSGADLIINSVLSGTSGAVTKLGLGTFMYSGAANTYTGATTVDEGTLLLQKTAGANAFNGALIIGDGIGAD